jgi:hypothetical protein
MCVCNNTEPTFCDGRQHPVLCTRYHQGGHLDAGQLVVPQVSLPQQISTEISSSSWRKQGTSSRGEYRRRGAAPGGDVVIFVQGSLKPRQRTAGKSTREFVLVLGVGNFESSLLTACQFHSILQYATAWMNTGEGPGEG